MPRKKRPTALKLADGTHRKHRDGDPEHEPAPEINQKLKPPSYVTGLGLRVWNEHAPQLIAVGLLTEVDRHIFALLCTAFAEFEVCNINVKKNGWFLKGSKGTKYPNPAIHLRNAARATVFKYCGKFGMSPSDRAGLEITLTGVVGQPPPGPAPTDGKPTIESDREQLGRLLGGEGA